MPKKRTGSEVQHDQGLRQDAQDATQITQGATQSEQGLTQVEQAATQVEQGATQTEQGATQTEQGATQVQQGIVQGEQADAIAAQTFHILAVTEGVHALAVNVETLNERVYTKNHLDRTRNILITGALAAFVMFSSALGILLWRLNETAHAEASRSRQRSAEAVAARRQLADCTTPPGTVLDGGYINPGVCFVDTNKRTQSYIDAATAKIEDDTRQILAGLADAVATNTSLTREVRSAAATQARVLRAPPALTSGTVGVQRPSPSPPPPPPASRNVLVSLLCSVLSLVGGC